MAGPSGSLAATKAMSLKKAMKNAMEAMKAMKKAMKKTMKTMKAMKPGQRGSSSGSLLRHGLCSRGCQAWAGPVAGNTEYVVVHVRHERFVHLIMSIPMM